MFYNQEFIVQLLLEYVADTSIKNIFDALESCDARSKWIRDNILNSKKTNFNFIKLLINKKLIKYKGQIIETKIMISENVFLYNIK